MLRQFSAIAHRVGRWRVILPLRLKAARRWLSGDRRKPDELRWQAAELDVKARKLRADANVLEARANMLHAEAMMREAWLA